jgi:hypothetical protein
MEWARQHAREDSTVSDQTSDSSANYTLLTQIAEEFATR